MMAKFKLSTCICQYLTFTVVLLFLIGSGNFVKYTSILIDPPPHEKKKERNKCSPSNKAIK